MENLNLLTDEEIKKSSGSFGGGLVGIVLVLVLTLLAYGGLSLWKTKLASDVESTKNAYTAQFSQLIASDDLKNVLDFQDRLSVSKDLIKEQISMPENLSKIEEAMVTPGVYLDSYKYDDKTKAITLSYMGDNYNLVAKQILSLKSSSYFSGVTGGETTFDKERSKINFIVNLKIK